MDDFYEKMGKAIKDRDHAKGRVLWWQDKVAQAEAAIEYLVTHQNGQTEEVSDGTE